MSLEFTPDRQLREAEAIELLQDILEVLAVAHRQNVIHWDINSILLMRFNSTLNTFKK